ncbi:MAG: N-acetylglucosamine-6-phosphate deacetylase [Candidatus Bathyarchaeota archaeon]|nr:N-acetylglucosamine-6-phosphate deacetylase [Candidatus Bathyarchaeota archaeon]MDH5635614.1 N-acetylglucosamine-6-phosphate deacetylase [Candidatus Bathyarchaeota archaeon]
MKKTCVIENGMVITPSKTIERGIVAFEDGKITAVGQKNRVKVPKSAKAIDASGKIVAPGFVDIHIHGGKGRDIMDASYEAVKETAKFLVSHGTTSFVPTTISAPRPDLLRAVKAVKTAMEKGTDGAEVLGAHLEGPYINLEKHGAHDANYVRLPSIDEFEELWEASNRAVKVVTLAPELEGSEMLIQKLRELGIVASIGHSNATYIQAVDAIKHGVRHATHMFNRMSGFDPREPGVVGAALVHDELTAELICDGIHVHPAAMNLLTRVKGPERVVLVTDAIRAAGMPDGEYALGKQRIIVKDGVSRLESGDFAGSTLTMDRAVRNIMKLVGTPLQTAVKMATINPAAVVNVDENKGSLELNKDADIVIIDDEVNVYLTIVKGKILYRS